MDKTDPEVVDSSQLSSEGRMGDPMCLEKAEEDISPKKSSDAQGVNLHKAELAPTTLHDEDDAGSGPVPGGETYPEGGTEAWLVVFGSWCALTASLGPMNSIATFQTYLVTHQLSDYAEGTVSWIFSIYTFLSFAAGIYAGPLFDKYGPRWLMLVGSSGIVLSLVLMSVCTKFWQYLLVFGILNGFATSLFLTPPLAAVGHYFRARRGLATGLASTGGGVGGVVFPLLLESLFDRVGWGWALRTLALVCLVLSVFANVLVRKRLPAAKNASPHPDFGILGDSAFLTTTIGVFMLELGLFIPLAYISSYALAQGFDMRLSLQLLPILNAASVLGRGLPGWWADKIGPFNSNILSLALTAVACLGVWLPFGHTMAGIIVFAILFGFGSGNNISITPVCVGRLCHTQNYGRYYATCYTIASMAVLIGSPVAGAVVLSTPGQGGHQYWGLVVFVGVTRVSATVLFVIARGLRGGWRFGVNI